MLSAFDPLVVPPVKNSGRALANSDVRYFSFGIFITATAVLRLILLCVYCMCSLYVVVEVLM